MGLFVGADLVGEEAEGDQFLGEVPPMIFHLLQSHLRHLLVNLLVPKETLDKLEVIEGSISPDGGGQEVGVVQQGVEGGHPLEETIDVPGIIISRYNR